MEDRIKAGEILVYPTDKSGKLAVTMPEAYVRQGHTDIKNDKIVQWKEVEETQRLVKGYLWALKRVFNLGKDHGENSEQRTGEAKQIANLTIPLVYLMSKDQKKITEGQTSLYSFQEWSHQNE